MEDYKDIYKEMMDFFEADNMEQVCLNLGFSKDSYRNWTRYRKVSDKALRRFNAIKSKFYSVAIGGNARIGGNAIVAGNITKDRAIDEDEELFELIRSYATPKMKAEFKEKLLAIKAISDA